MSDQRFWVGTVSKEHVERGKLGGFAQVCHGKEAPLKRMHEGDILIYYSPNIKYGERIPCQCFTALGIVSKKLPFQVQMAPDFIPYRRDVLYLQTNDAPIKPLVEKLQFIQNKNNWGYIFRFGILKINKIDFEYIAKAMGLPDEKIHELLI